VVAVERAPETTRLANPHLPRATVNAECVTAYNDLKLNKKYKYVIYKLSDDNKEIVVDSTSEEAPEYEQFREKLINAQSKSKTVCLTPKRFGTVCGNGD
jgi:hypothetical protein